MTKNEKEFEDYTDLFFEARGIEKEHPDEALEKYMDILSRFKPDGTLYYERPAILLERNKRYEEAIEVCKLALKNLKANNPSTYEGTKQEFTKRIERCKVKIAKANGTWKPEPKPDMPKVDRPTEQQLIAEIKSAVTPSIVFPDWYVSVSFGYSKSDNFSKALALAKSAPQFVENVEDGQLIYQAIYSNKQSEYLAFIKLYELVGNWKSCFVIINGEHVDRKIIGQINYCYGDCCRSGNPDFCYGASMFTDNPFGCHRLQMSAFNHPWYSFGTVVNNRYIQLDKKQIIERAMSYAEIYKFCPKFDWKRIEQRINSLPDQIDMKEHPELRTTEYGVACTTRVRDEGNIHMSTTTYSDMKKSTVQGAGTCLVPVLMTLITIVMIVIFLLGL